MGEAKTLKETKPRKWYELHFRTVVALTLAATILIWANVLPNGGCNFNIRTCRYISRGWPVEAVSLQWWLDPGEPFHMPDNAELFLSPSGIVVDLLVAVGVLALVALLCEWRARSPRARWLYLRRSTGFAVFLLGEVLLLISLYHANNIPVKKGTRIYDYSGGWPVWYRSGPVPGKEASSRGPAWVELDEKTEVVERAWEVAFNSFVPHAALANLLVALFVLAAAALLCEAGIRTYKRVRSQVRGSGGGNEN